MAVRKETGLDYERAIRRAVLAAFERSEVSLTPADLARAAGFSAFHFSRMFGGMMGESPGEFLWKVQEASHLVQGILNRTMLMDEPREWLDVGRFLERADQTNRLLDVKYHDILPSIPQRRGQPPETLPDPLGVGGPLDTHGWIAVLKSVSAFEMYRKTYRDGIVPANVVAFLELQPEFPASVRHGVKRVLDCLKRIRKEQTAPRLRAPEQLALKLLADLEFDQADQIIETGLHEYLQDKQDRMAALGAAIRKAYLA